MTTATKAQVKAAAKTRIPRASETVSHRTPTASHKLTTGEQFTAAPYLPGDLFTASSSVPSISEAEYTERLEKIQGQIRQVKIVQQNLTLTKELHAAEGIAIEGQIQVVKNATLYEKLATQGVKLQQAQVGTAIESARLQGLQITLNGETASLPLQQEGWNLKLEGLRVDIEHARRMLAEKREMLQAQTINVIAH